MKYLLFCIYLLFGVQLWAQSDNAGALWQISVQPNQWLSAPMADSIGLQVPKKSKQKEVLIAYNKKETTAQWHRHIIIMDSARHELLRKPLVNNQLALSKSMLHRLNKGNPLYLYTIAIPVDERRARTVRVRTVLLTKLVW